MMRNNKGFSLIELIVALAILSVAGVSIFGFVMNTSNSYSQTNKEVKLQYEQQLAVNQIRDMVVESDKGIYFDSTSKTLALYGAAKTEGTDTKYPVTVLRFVESEGKLYFGTKDFTTVSEISFAAITDLSVLSENVTKFEVDLTGVKKDKVQLELTFTVGEKEQNVKETIALRNRLVVSNAVDTIWGEEIKTVDSFIKGIYICRGTKKFANGEMDTIGKSGESVVVAYSATVVASDESERDYAVKWSLESVPAGVSITEDGMVTVTRDVTPSSIFRLRATSVDDGTKSCYINIQIEETGIYAVNATLACSEPIVGNGQHTYTLVPTLYYTNSDKNGGVSDYSLFTWEGVDSLPNGCVFHEDTGTLVLTSAANGCTFTIRAKATERNSKGEAIYSNDVVIIAKDIPEYVTGPKARIAVAPNLSRGGYVFPTMVLENATSSNYTYYWQIEPYYDKESTKWDGDVANSRFTLVSLAESGGYQSGNVRDEMQTGANQRSIALNCAVDLNWTKTFKVMIHGKAVDEKGNELVATSRIVTIEPVDIKIEMTDGKAIGGSVLNWDGDKPIVTDSVLRYEDWYWEGKEKGSELAKYSPTRRWFTISCSNLYVTGSSTQNIYTLGCSVEQNFSFEDQVGVLISEGSVSRPETRFTADGPASGFSIQMINWEGTAYYKPAYRPVYMNYSVTLKDNNGNSETSNIQRFTIDYDFYDPTEE